MCHSQVALPSSFLGNALLYPPSPPDPTVVHGLSRSVLTSSAPAFASPCVSTIPFLKYARPQASKMYAAPQNASPGQAPAPGPTGFSVPPPATHPPPGRPPKNRSIGGNIGFPSAAGLPFRGPAAWPQPRPAGSRGCPGCWSRLALLQGGALWLLRRSLFRRPSSPGSLLSPARSPS